MALRSCASKDIFKNKPCLMTDTHHGILDLVNHRVVKNTKTYNMKTKHNSTK